MSFYVALGLRGLTYINEALQIAIRDWFDDLPFEFRGLIGM